MAREITQRELRTESAALISALEVGESFVVMRNGVAVGELTPVRPRRLVDARVLTTAFRTAASLDTNQFRADVDDAVDQDPSAR